MIVRAPRHVRGRQRDAGYNLVALAVMITVLNILVAKALPLWSAVIQREKEAELIFRGMQYAEAIRVYEKRFNKLPVKLEELIEVEPRTIRQLWENPMDEDGAWELIPAGQGQPLRGQNPTTPDGRAAPEDPNRPSRLPLPGDPSRPDPSRLWIPGSEENRLGSFPIGGVKSPSGGTSIKTFVTNPSAPDGGGSNEISEWLFTIDLAKALVVPYDSNNPTPVSMNVEQRFRPWPPNIKPVYVPQSTAGAGESAVEGRGSNRGNGNRGGNRGNRGEG